MAKRFVDSQLWERDWYLALTPVEKIAWHYITENCDPVGVWPCAFKKAEFCIGAEVDWDHLVKASNGNIEVLPNGKWWLRDFCEFQYGELNDACKPHRHYIELLAKHGLKGYSKKAKPISRLKEKEKELEEEPEKEIADGSDQKTIISEFSRLFVDKTGAQAIITKPDWIQAAKIAKRPGVNACLRALNAYFLRDAWFNKDGRSFGNFVRHINDIISSLPKLRDPPKQFDMKHYEATGELREAIGVSKEKTG